jgi:hypothetical protein
VDLSSREKRSKRCRGSLELLNRESGRPYKWLGERIDAHPFTVVPRSLGLVGSALEKLEPKLGKIPPIQLVVVGGPSGIPGDSGLTWTGVSKEELSSWKGSFFERRPEGSV